MLKTSLMFIVAGVVLLFVFVSAGIIRFGLLDSYSSYSPKWARAVPMNNTSLWDTITFIAGVFMLPAIFQLAPGCPWMFLGLLAPIYMMITALKPNWNTSRNAFLTHSFFTLLGTLGTVIWGIFVLHMVKVVTIMGVFYMTIALLTGTLKSSAVFWAELWMFVTAYLSIIFLLI